MVIGVHREELAFGDKVAEALDESRFALLRIAHGLSARRPRPDEQDRYLANHALLYHQIAERVEPSHRLLIDLHCRQCQPGEAAGCGFALC